MTGVLYRDRGKGQGSGSLTLRLFRVKVLFCKFFYSGLGVRWQIREIIAFVLYMVSILIKQNFKIKISSLSTVVVAYLVLFLEQKQLMERRNF